MPRQIPGDWCEVGIPDNANLHDTAYVATSLSFMDYRSRRDVGLSAGEGAGIYYGCMFDVGPAGRVSLGRCCLLTAAVVLLRRSRDHRRPLPDLVERRRHGRLPPADRPAGAARRPAIPARTGRPSPRPVANEACADR